MAPGGGTSHYATRKRVKRAVAGLLLGLALSPGVAARAAEPPVPADPTVDNEDEPPDPGAVDEGEAAPEDPTDIEDEEGGSGGSPELPINVIAFPSGSAVANSSTPLFTG